MVRVWNWPVTAKDLNLESLVSVVCTRPHLIGVAVISKNKYADEGRNPDIALFPVGLGLQAKACVGNAPDPSFCWGLF